MPTRDEAMQRWKVETRIEAHSRGADHYFTGKPCKHGHWEQRTVAYGVCVACNRLNASKFRSSMRGGYVTITLPVHPGDVDDIKAFAVMLQAARDAKEASRPAFAAPVVPGTPANWNPPPFLPR